MSEHITEAVMSKYGSVARGGYSSSDAGVRRVAEAFGYTAEELASIPAEANMGLSCGNPTATASLRAGEVVVDLGSGGGLDVFLAAQKVGALGKAIGVDMTPDMIDLARRNAAARLRQGATDNVEFHLATIDRLPLPDGSVDCVISNCVINLAPDKVAVFREIARILKPGGRLAASDIALKRQLPPEIRNDLMAYVGCVAGAILVDDYRATLRDAGFAEVEIIDTGSDLNAYAAIEGQAGCCSPAMSEQTNEPKSLPLAASSCCAPAPASGTGGDAHGDLAEMLRRYDVNDYAASVRVLAVKSAAAVSEPEATRAATGCCAPGCCAS